MVGLLASRVLLSLLVRRSTPYFVLRTYYCSVVCPLRYASEKNNLAYVSRTPSRSVLFSVGAFPALLASLTRGKVKIEGRFDVYTLSQRFVPLSGSGITEDVLRTQ